MSDFDVFLSYRRSDGSAFAKTLARRLRTAHARIPGKPRPLRVYLDRMQARADLNFYEETTKPALLSARWLLLLATPDAQARPEGTPDWIAREIDDFTRVHGNARIRVALAKGDTVPQLPHDLHLAMSQAQQIDLRGLRGIVSGNRAQEDWENLLATLFDVPDAAMPALRREQEKQRQNVIAAIVGGAVGAAAFATAVSGYAIFKTAESRQLLNRTATVLDATETGDCGALQLLWDAGATQRALPAMQCLIRAADDLWFDGDKVGAHARLGTWEKFVAAFPTSLADVPYEAEEARLTHALNAIWYDHIDATGEDLFDIDTISQPGLPTAFRAIDEIARSLLAIEDLSVAFDTLQMILWPLLNGLETAGQDERAKDLMTRAFEMTAPNAANTIELGASEMDHERLIDHAALARRIAFFERGLGDTDAAQDWSQRAISLFAAFSPAGPRGQHQHALAHLVHGQIAVAQGADATASFEAALALAQEVAAQQDPPDDDILALIKEIRLEMQ